MDFPASLSHEIFKKKIVNAVNESKLPPFVVEDVLRVILADVHELAIKAVQKDREEYEKSIKEEQKDE